MNDARPLRIAVTSYYLPSESKIGAGWMAHRLANELCARGHAVTMFSPCRRPGDARYEHRHVPITGRLRTFRWALRLRELDLSGFDVLHAHGDDHLIRRHSVASHVRTLHGSCFDEAVHATGAKERLRMFLLGVTEAAAAVRVPVVVGVSRNAIRWYPWLREVVPNGVDVGRFHPGRAREPAPTVLFVGTYHRRKRGELLVRVFQDYVRPRVPDATLWMVCDDAPAAPGVEVLGRVSDDELAERYRRAWLFCLPSSYEGFGVPYIEAMLSGTTVVASRNLGAREVLAHGRYGVLARDDELGRAIVRLLVDDRARDELAVRALSQRDRYAWPTVAEAYERIYRARAGHGAPAV